MKIYFRIFVSIVLSHMYLANLAHAKDGQFIGELTLQFGSDGRTGTLVNDFGYIDSSGRRWDVPAKAVVDGASIPWGLWSIIGSPWTGKYRRASVIHDYYCVTKDRGWRNVHRVFYDAMITDGVGTIQAKIMYGGVLQFGPKWKKELGVDGNPRIVSHQPPFDQKRFEEFRAWVNSENPPLSEIEKLVE